MSDNRAQRSIKRVMTSIVLTPEQVSQLTDACHRALSDPPTGLGADAAIIQIEGLLALAKTSTASHSEADLDVRALQRHAAVLLRKHRTSLNPNP